MNKLHIDEEYLCKTLVSLLNIPSPAGYTDQIVHFVGRELEKFGIPFDVTRRGAIRATLPGREKTFARAVAVHLDTLGAMVKDLKENGRLGILPVGTWSARFAEGARVTVFTEKRPCRGTILPLKASGHTYGDEIDSQPVNWENTEIRIDERCRTRRDLIHAGFNVGDFVAVDAAPEITGTGFINARHLDDKAGVAIILAVIRSIADGSLCLPVPCHLLFTIAEEVGIGASAMLYGDVGEMVVLDNATVAPGQYSWEFGVTIGMMDAAGPFDYHLTRKLIGICREQGIEYSRDVFRHYRSDSASAIEAGNDTRTALVGFGVDGSHGYERTHMLSLLAVSRLMGHYMQSPPTFARDKDEISTLSGFPHQPERDIIHIQT
ncbi:MAG: osmoprotectant NAGGN system M42 family peptidase [Desulfococcaceae bacterium]|jgi:peptidase M42 family hydrolase|nr:osmoprotectant NAGGN system M42 family peptidase [Desulfococcaceae bacterium]